MQTHYPPSDTPQGPQLEWTKTIYGKGMEVTVPKIPGLYAIANVSRLHGLPVQVDLLYVGQSNNLRRRYKEHLNWDEPNPHLGAIRRTNSYEFWWTGRAVTDLDLAEADLIEALAPPANRKRGNRKRQKDTSTHDGSLT
jgi:excinuclease UvrABC nuclease subunit